MKRTFYFLVQAVFTGYCLFMGFNFDGLFYLFLIGLINIAACFLIISRKQYALIISILFYVLILLFYAYLFFDLLIVRGFINEPTDPFLIMGIIIHSPVILYCLIATICLINIYKNTTKATSE